jgi:threonine synthase
MAETALIVGAGSGLSASLARLFAREGVRVALAALARKGFYVEPTSAAAAAGLSQLIARGAVKQGETTVLVLTGTGLKASESIGKILKLAARGG